MPPSACSSLSVLSGIDSPPISSKVRVNANAPSTNMSSRPASIPSRCSVKLMLHPRLMARRIIRALPPDAAHVRTISRTYASKREHYEDLLQQARGMLPANAT